MPNDQLGLFYDAVYRDLYSGSNDVPTREFVADQEARGRRALELCRPWLSSRGLVLDVGCGAGATLLPFRDEGHAVVGIEPGPYAIWGAGHLGIDIRRSSVDDLATLGLTPDLIVLSFVLEHVPSPKEVLATSHRLLRDEGLIFIEVPNLKSIRGPVEQFFHVAHLTYFTPKTLIAMLELCGFRPVAVEAGRNYSMRVVARRAASAGPTAGDLGAADDAAAIRSFVIRHGQIARVEFGLRAVLQRTLQPVATFLRLIIGRERTEHLVAKLRTMARRARYGDDD
jgi:SAM-dependent methyltransferase